MAAKKIYDCEEPEFRTRIVQFVNDLNLKVKELQTRVDEMESELNDIGSLKDRIEDLEQAERLRVVTE